MRLLVVSRRSGSVLADGPLEEQVGKHEGCGRPASQTIRAARIQVLSPLMSKPPTTRSVITSATRVEMIPTPPLNAEAFLCTSSRINGDRIPWTRAKMTAATT